jgi:hypothetical protein
MKWIERRVVDECIGQISALPGQLRSRLGDRPIKFVFLTTEHPGMPPSCQRRVLIVSPGTRRFSRQSRPSEFASCEFKRLQTQGAGGRSRSLTSLDGSSKLAARAIWRAISIVRLV